MKSQAKGILAVIGSSAAMFLPGAFVFGYPGVMGPHWQRMFQVGQGAVGTTLFFVLVAVGSFMFLVGHWQERFGVSRMISTGAVISCLSAIVIAYASSIYIIYLWAFLTGLASCFVYIPALTAVQRWYPAKKGLVSGFVNMMFGLSGAIMAPVFARLLLSMGYVRMNLSLGIIALLVGAGAARFTKSPDGGESDKPDAGQTRATMSTLNGSLTVRQSVLTRSFWCLWITWTLQGGAGIAMVTLSTAFGLSRGFALERAVILLTAFNIMNGMSRLLVGTISDVVGRRAVMSTTFFAGGCAYFVLPYVQSFGLSAVLAAVIGLAFGTLFAVSAPLVVDCFGLRHFGAIMGLAFTGYGFFSGLIGPSLGGYLLDVTQGDFRLVLTFLGVLCVLSGVLIRFVVPPR